MPKFAVYYVPQANEPFYRLGTALLGYDVRAQTTVALPADLQRTLAPFDPAWTTIARPYGFHLTITEAIMCHEAVILRVEQELADLLACLDPAHPLLLHRAEHPLGIWGEPGKYSLVLRYEPNASLRMLHTLLVARITPLGYSSSFVQHAATHPEQSLPPHLAQQLRLFYSPTVLDNWYPHFTLLNPYPADKLERMASHLMELFSPFTELTVKTVCLLLQMHDHEHWHIYREFRHPSPLADGSISAH